MQLDCKGDRPNDTTAALSPSHKHLHLSRRSAMQTQFFPMRTTLVFLLAVPLWAQDPLSLRDAVRLAIRENRAIAGTAAGARASAARARSDVRPADLYFCSPFPCGHRILCRPGTPSASLYERIGRSPALPRERGLPKRASHRPAEGGSPKSTTPSPSRAAITRSSSSVRCSHNTNSVLRTSPSAP